MTMAWSHVKTPQNHCGTEAFSESVYGLAAQPSHGKSLALTNLRVNPKFTAKPKFPIRHSHSARMAVSPLSRGTCGDWTGGCTQRTVLPRRTDFRSRPDTTERQDGARRVILAKQCTNGRQKDGEILVQHGVSPCKLNAFETEAGQRSA